MNFSNHIRIFREGVHFEGYIMNRYIRENGPKLLHLIKNLAIVTSLNYADRYKQNFGISNQVPS